MKAVTIILRVLLGLIFVVFGLNGFLHFLSMPSPAPPAAAFAGALAATGYMFPLVMSTQIIGGALLLSGLFVPFAVVLLAPVIVNIVAFHVFLDPAGLPLAVLVAALEIGLAWIYRGAFAALFK